MNRVLKVVSDLSAFRISVRYITTSKSGKEPVPAPKIDEEEDDPVKKRISHSGKASDIEEASKSWYGQLPHEFDPTIEWDRRLRVKHKDGQEYEDEISVEGNAWAANMFKTSFLIKLHTKRDWGLAGFRRWRTRTLYAEEVRTQLFNNERHGILGPDLATAHFICFREGAVKFVGYDKWWYDHTLLPQRYDPMFLIEQVDATDCKLFYEGIDNICNLHQMTELNLTNNSKLDVWAFDKLYRQYRFSSKLEKLVLRNCTLFCERSLGACHRIPSLREIVITNTAAAKYPHLDLVIHLLNDVNPRIKVVV